MFISWVAKGHSFLYADSDTHADPSYCVFVNIIYPDQRFLAHKAPNTTIAEFANTVDPDEMAHNEPSHQDLQCSPSSL